MNKVYKLKIDTMQMVDGYPNVHKIKDDDYLDLSRLLAFEKHELTEEKIIARANFDQINNYDFIQNEMNIPILSSKFVNVLNLVDVDGIILVPVILLCDKTPPNKIFKTIGYGIKDSVLKNMNFSTLKFINQFNYCDIEKSTFRKLSSQPDSLGILKEVVLREPKSGFPALFRIKESVSILFITEQAKKKIELNNIKGCIFEEVEVTPYQK